MNPLHDFDDKSTLALFILFVRDFLDNFVMPFLLVIYLWLMVILPWLSSLLYIFFPDETMKYFGGIPTSSAAFWVQVVASGDVLIGFLALVGLRTRNTEVLKLVLQAIAVYNIFHMCTFWYDHTFRKTHPRGPISYIILLVISLIACGWWVWLRPYHPNNESLIQNKTEMKKQR